MILITDKGSCTCVSFHNNITDKSTGGDGFGISLSLFYIYPKKKCSVLACTIILPSTSQLNTYIVMHMYNIIER